LERLRLAAWAGGRAAGLGEGLIDGVVELGDIGDLDPALLVTTKMQGVPLTPRRSPRARSALTSFLHAPLASITKGMLRPWDWNQRRVKAARSSLLAM